MVYFSQQLQLPQRRSRGPVSPWESGFGLPAPREWRGSVISKMELFGGKTNTNRQLFMVDKVWLFLFHRWLNPRVLSGEGGRSRNALSERCLSARQHLWMLISLPLCCGALKCKGKTLLITLLLKDQQPGEMYFVTFSLWSLFFIMKTVTFIQACAPAHGSGFLMNRSCPFPGLWLRGTAGAAFGVSWLPPEMQILPLGERVLVSHLVSSALGRIQPVLPLSHIVEVREDARCSKGWKEKFWCWISH